LKNFPLVTVIMPVRNEGAYMERSLRSVLAQNYPLDRIEVIIADGMSSDNTTEIVRAFQESHPCVMLIQNPGLIAPVGLNLAIANARGEIIVRVDGHCEIAPDYVSRCVAHLQNEGVQGVGGPIDTIGETFIARCIALAMSSKFGVGGSAFRTVRGKSMLTDTVAFPAYSRKAIERTGRYDEELVRNQDDEYNFRLRKLGGRILLAPDVHCRYYSRGSLRSLWRQYFQYGYWKVRVMQKHPLQMSLRQFVPAAFIMALVASVIASLLAGRAEPFLFLLGLYLVSNTAASLITAGCKSALMFVMLPVVFCVLHFSYGSGFIVGLMRFRKRWGTTKTDSWQPAVEKSRSVCRN
jgi:succinoglycan biosynthesis protein ExoA